MYNLKMIPKILQFFQSQIKFIWKFHTLLGGYQSRSSISCNYLEWLCKKLSPRAQACNRQAEKNWKTDLYISPIKRQWIL